jgi:hypothetical protein
LVDLEGDLDVLVVTNKAATASSTSVGSGHSTLLGPGGAVDKLVLGPARRVAVGALEDAGVHAGLALGGLDGHVVTLHVDLTGHVESAVGTVEGEFTPSLRDLTVDKLGVVVDGSPAAADSGSVGNVESGSVVDGVGDEGNVDVDPAGSGTPDNKSDILAAQVLELAGVITIVAQPGRAAVVGLGVGTSKNTDGGKNLGENIRDESTLGNSESAGKSQVGKDGKRGEGTHVSSWEER